ncbi:MAG: tripartite tricarboxylate transporter substrate binding protein [Burkholderiales bacterium]|nr:tripartite tricarboxylate transporter substrate binding protein [Burkholderiales bacterium]
MTLLPKLLLLVAALVPLQTAAQEYPTRPIRVIVPFPPGGAADTMARLIAPQMSKALGQNLTIENRPGANTVIATEIVARAPADGYTMLVMATSFTVNPFAYSKLPYDTLRDFHGVTRMVYNPLIFCAHPSLPVKNMKELAALAKKRPGELSWGVSSIIGGGRIAGELFNDIAGINMINVPFGGGAPATTAILGGHITLLVGNVLDCSQYIPSGRLRGLAVTSAQRASNLPQVPTIAESGWPGFESLNWFGTMVRAGTPRPIVERLSAEVAKSLKTPEAGAILARQGFSEGTMSPADYDAYIRNEMQRNEKILKKLNLKLD